MRSYEIQTFKDGKWRLDSIFDDRELAILEAKKIDEGTRYAGVKVLEASALYRYIRTDRCASAIIRCSVFFKIYAPSGPGNGSQPPNV